jgi:putative endonuclease
MEKTIKPVAVAGHIDLGRKGEQVAVDFLVKKGYKILARNWRFGKNEVDIIVVVAEVKSRSSNLFAEPETAVTRDKQRILVRAANAYVNSRKLQGEVRFDVIAILLLPEAEKINHIEDAFYATL